jgi:hypothetical protein
MFVTPMPVGVGILSQWLSGTDSFPASPKIPFRAIPNLEEVQSYFGTDTCPSFRSGVEYELESHQHEVLEFRH